MNSWLEYLFQVAICHGLYYGVYVIFLKRLSFSRISRFVLLAVVFLGFLLPALDIPFWTTAARTIPELHFSKTMWNANSVSATEQANLPAKAFSLATVAMWLYGLGVFFFAGQFLMGMYRLCTVIKQNKQRKHKGVTLVQTAQGAPFFSFWKYLFLSPHASTLSSSELNQVMAHEKAHIREWHTLDNVLMELCIIVCWFNPFLRLLRNELRNTHECFADEQGLQKAKSPIAYAQLLLDVSPKASTHLSVTNFFTSNNLKHRIVMINKTQNTANHKLKYIVMLPIVLVLLGLFSFVDKETTNSTLTHTADNDPIISQIEWSGNTKYSSEELNALLDLHVGSPINKSSFDEKMFGTGKGSDLSSLYMDHGYLFFNVEPEFVTEGNNVRISIKVYEGGIVNVGAVSISGNSKHGTDEILSLLTVKPGAVFSRSEIITSQKKLAETGWFVVDSLSVIPTPIVSESKVNIVFEVVEI